MMAIPMSGLDTRYMYKNTWFGTLINYLNNDLELAHPLSGSLLT